MPREFSAGAVVFYRSHNTIEYLLLRQGTRETGTKRSRGLHWDFPKGHIEGTESIRDTARREIYEETGIRKLQFIPGFEQKIRYFFMKHMDKNGKRVKAPVKPRGVKSSHDKKSEDWIFKMVFFLLARAKTKKVRLSLEHVAYKWLPFPLAQKQLTHKNAKEILKKADEFLCSYYGRGNKNTAELPQGQERPHARPLRSDEHARPRANTTRRNPMPRRTPPQPLGQGNRRPPRPHSL